MFSLQSSLLYICLAHVHRYLYKRSRVCSFLSLMTGLVPVLLSKGGDFVYCPVWWGYRKFYLICLTFPSNWMLWYLLGIQFYLYFTAHINYGWIVLLHQPSCKTVILTWSMLNIIYSSLKNDNFTEQEI